MDRFKDDFEKVRDIEKTINDNLKERQKATKAGQSTTKVQPLFKRTSLIYLLL